MIKEVVHKLERKEMNRKAKWPFCSEQKLSGNRDLVNSVQDFPDSSGTELFPRLNLLHGTVCFGGNCNNSLRSIDL